MLKKEAEKVLFGIPGISFIYMNESDIVRHKLVTCIVNAYDKYEKGYLEENNKNTTK